MSTVYVPPKKAPCACQPARGKDDTNGLRDKFAGQAMSGILTRSGKNYDDIAIDAYRMADAMLRARKGAAS